MCAAPASAAAVRHWRIFFTSPHGPTDLTHIASTGPKNAWAVGDDRTGLYVRHWNGARWQPVSVPGARGFSPDAVDATTAGNVWIIGTTTSPDQPTALVYDGRGWHTTSLPSANAAVLSKSDVWGIGSGGGCTEGATPVCTSAVWHWHNGSVSSYQVPGQVAAVIGGGKRAWILSQRAIRDPGGQRMSSLAALYYGDAAGLHAASAPSGRMGIFPQLAASPAGHLWLLMPGLSRHNFGAVEYWNGRTWARHAIPTASDISFGSWGFTYDDHRGVWLGPYVHWTGSRWISTDPHGPNQAFELMYVAPVPTRQSAWAVGFSESSRPSVADRGLIALYGSRP
jgi:hypothetical protein